MTPRSHEALIALRRIQRMIELKARSLASIAGLTPSQLIVLQLLEEHGEQPATFIAKSARLTNATITSLIDKLEARGLVRRTRDALDRRRVQLALTDQGRATLRNAPDLLQDTFTQRFEALEGWEQAMLIAALERVAALLDAGDLDAAPVLDVGPLDQQTV